MQWLPALILVLPAGVAAVAAWRPSAVTVLLALFVTTLLDFATYFAFWLQADWRSTGDTVRLSLFLAVPAGLITLTTLYALARGITQALGGAGNVSHPH